MADIKMTNKKALEEALAIETLSAEAKEKIKGMIATIDKRNEKRSSKPTKAQKENEPIVKAIIDTLTNAGRPMLSVDIATAIGVSSNKVNGLAKALVENGTVVKGTMAVKGKGKQTTYAIAEADEADEEDNEEGADEE